MPRRRVAKPLGNDTHHRPLFMSSVPHHLEYSKTSKAKCNGAPPCKGSLIPAGTLRYGATVQSDFGEIVRWMHWGCVTSAILGRLAAYGVHRVAGFQSLRTEDQERVRKALATRRVDPADVPTTARPPAAVLPPIPAPAFTQASHLSSAQASRSQQSQPVSAAPGPSVKKRKAAVDAAPSAADPSTVSSVTTNRARRIVDAVDLTWEEGAQEDDAEIVQPIDELYCAYKAKIVGVQYYHGLVAAGQQVNIIREPNNRYDRNAIKVTNIQNEQVGHLPRDLAQKLAPLMDKGFVRPEGIMDEGNMVRGSKFSLDLTLKIYGDTNKRSTLEPLLTWATLGGRGFSRNAASTYTRGVGPSQAGALGNGYTGYPTGIPSSQGAYSSSQGYPSNSQFSSGEQAARQKGIQEEQEAFTKASELREILSNLEKVSDENRRHSLLDTLCSAEDVLGLPVHSNPPGKASGELTVNLLKHQSQALRWCINAESPVLPQTESDKPVQFWQVKKMVATKTPQANPPVLGRGALCADSMGLGKTLTMLSLIVSTKEDSHTGFSKSTLVVVPLSVVSNWEKQIQDHCTPGTLRYVIYYDKTRGMSPQELAKYDVVITTYQTVAGEHASAQGISPNGGAPAKKKKKTLNALFVVQWKRIILDEGHNIRNERTKIAQAVYALNGQRRWVLTGTPIINSPSDLGSIVRFLRICNPLDNSDYFKRLLVRPLKDGDPAGSEMLRALMTQICIRRTKEMQDSDGKPLVPLPPVDVTVVPVALHDEARQLYDQIEELSKARIEEFMDATGERAALANVALTTNALSMLTRLRQLALHPGLIPPDYAEQLMKVNEEESDSIQITPEEKLRLQSILAQAIEDNEECPICFDTMDNPRITVCAHRFCLACITEVINHDNKCPMDRRKIGLNDLTEPLPPMDLTQAPVYLDNDEEDASMHELRHRSSAKIDQLIRLLELTPSKEKSLVFSQFTSFLDKVAETLDGAGIPYVRFDGQMSSRRRQEALERFCVPITDEDEATPVPRAPAPSQASTSGTRTRRKTAPKQVVDDGDGVPAGDGDDDADFGPMPEIDDDEFIDEDGDSMFMSKGRGRVKKGKGKGKAKTTRFAKSANAATYLDPPEGINPKVMLISLKAGALGLNLTVANNVYLWWQEGIESQAIDRCNRIGQTRPVHVYQLVAENTVESKVIDIQEKKKKLVQEAFSGMKNKETQRQKKEARLQDIIHLFGIQRGTDCRPARPGPRQTTLQLEVA
ncbi:SNF2 family N-terminal domain-containing protein [Vararia minispora EC-137]|uniref:SNF2 family N-terminal domain-containing protein n=1 Tax=Vararia minispora EC-137 TaxID=1314806 RepID=A0ACB8QVH7_9AGAM|nr:SNF2 family N-terminal domain-containing protein [Vararia minispora EC-137]